MTSRLIIPECYADTELMKALVQKDKDIIHAHGSGGVANRMQRLKNIQRVIGVVDEDKKKTQPSYFADFTQEEIGKNGIVVKVKKDEHGTQHLIMICPAFEVWFLDAVKSVNVSLPSDWEADAKWLHDSVFGKKELDATAKGFLTVVASKKPASFVTLKDWIDKLSK